MRPLHALLALALIPAQAMSQDQDEALLEGLLPPLRAARPDLNVRPERWETGFTLSAVEAVLADPLKAPGLARSWSAALGAERGLAAPLLLGARALDLPIAEASPAPAPLPLTEPRGLPPELIGPLESLLGAVRDASSLARRAADSLSASERERVLAAVKPFLAHDEGPRVDAAAFDIMGRFDQGAMLAAGLLLARAAETELPRLPAAAARAGRLARERWTFPFGDLLVSGPGDDAYGAEDLAGVALLVDLGGRSRYRGPVAAARDGQVRLVIDLGSEVSIDAPEAPAGGSGLFGVGMLYLPNPEGAKILKAGDLSLGAGLFGVGGLFLRGKADLDGQHFTQGAGGFGAGLLAVEGEGARYRAVYSGQGYGFTKGAGVWLHRGGGARAEGGLTYPDPREERAAASLCQGVGLGPRAFAAGGVGLVLAEGDRNEFSASYFAHGSGYWHGLGGFFLKGTENRLHARRYSQGAGVHTAVGLLQIEGDGNETANWGVGPAYGWDYGVGYLGLRGDKNSLYAEWGTGHGDVNGHGLAAVAGRGNRLSLVEFGTGAFKRAAPSFGLAAVLGEDNRLRAPALSSAAAAGPALRANPWGVVSGDSLILDPGLKIEAPAWPDFDRAAAARRERATLQSLWNDASEAPPDERTSLWLSIAASFTLDSEIPRQAAHRLLSLPLGRIPRLPGLLDPRRFDEYLWLRLLIPAYGRLSLDGLAAELASAAGLRKALLLGLYRNLPAAQAVPTALSAINDADWRVRGAAGGVLGAHLDRAEGEEAGRRVLLKESLEPGENLPARVGLKRLPELFSVLALDNGLSAAERGRLLDKSPSPHDPAGAPAFAEYAAILSTRAAEYRAVIGRELKDAEQAEGEARKALLRLLKDPEPEVLKTALMALGGLGRPQDAARLEGFLSHASAGVREAAAGALGRMGEPAREAVSKALEAKEPRTRALAALAAAQSWSPKVLLLLEKAFTDSDRDVRATAASSLLAFQSPLQDRRKDFRAALERLAASDPDPSVRASAGLALGSVPR